VPAPVNVPQQPELSKPTPFAQPVPPSMGRQVDSVYIMEVGQNGEIQKANMPVEPAATNSLMIDAQNVVPISKCFCSILKLISIFRRKAGYEQAAGNRVLISRTL
jgi:hypothetical protein